MEGGRVTLFNVTLLFMDSNMYRGKINIVAVGLCDEQALFVINEKNYITVDKKFVLNIAEMVKTPHTEANQLRFSFSIVLDGIKERNCYIQFRDYKYIATVETKEIEISENLLQSFVLSGFLKRFIDMEENRLYKPNFIEIYNENKLKEDILKQRQIIKTNDENNYMNNIVYDDTLKEVAVTDEDNKVLHINKENSQVEKQEVLEGDYISYRKILDDSKNDTQSNNFISKMKTKILKIKKSYTDKKG